MALVRVEAHRHPSGGWLVLALTDPDDVPHTFVVRDRDMVTLDTVAEVATHGTVAAGDRWCATCQNRLRHDWVIRDSLLVAECARGHVYPWTASP